MFLGCKVFSGKKWLKNGILGQKIISLDFSVIFMVAGFWEEDDISSIAVDNLSSVYFIF